MKLWQGPSLSDKRVSKGSSHSEGSTNVMIYRSPHIKQMIEEEDRLHLPIDIEFYSYIN